jgi:uncharacterized protein YdeI (YjbR/CyaY-like superfamily)
VKPVFFKTPAEVRAWMEANHATVPVLIVGFYRKASGKRSVTYHEALDEALAFGWIDGIRKSQSADSYTSRFTPRRPKSYWSRVNIARVKELIAKGRMAAPGLAAFNARNERRPDKYTYERKTRGFDPAQTRQFKANPKAWEFFEAQPPGYRKLMIGFVRGAVKEETRARRLAELIELSARGRRVDLMAPRKKS